MRRLTGTHVYSYVKCPRLAALDLHLPRSERRAPSEWEEFAAQRGRDFEAHYVKGLDVVSPVYPERDFEAGATATLALLREGAPLLHQAVLFVEDRLGLPDLLRRVPGASALGDWHYEVLDVKTSGRSRGDQILQVVFYTELIAAVQQRMPEHGALVLKDGREQRFLIADYRAAGREVVTELARLRDDMDAARPFLQMGCANCYHDQRCLSEMQQKGDLSLVQGMSHGAQAILEAAGCRTVQDLAVWHPDGARARGNLDATLVRRLRRAAQAHLLGKPLVEERPRGERFDQAAIVHLLGDPFADRVLAFGVLHPATEEGAFTFGIAHSADEEWAVLKELLAPLGARTVLLHFGEALPRWYEEHAFAREADTVLEARFVDLGRRLRAAAVYPRAVFGLGDLVREGLGRDPLRAGHAGAAALWATLPDGELRLRDKLRADLEDLAALKAQILDAAPTRVTSGEAVG
ncbi:MAG TPA: TM0106 family RecB-like putative nuclease [Planctomycetota bacterium]|nr:TM0106 family RecB-like putative nuclease [Planctomycetota bacterium]